MWNTTSGKAKSTAWVNPNIAANVKVFDFYIRSTVNSNPYD